jgi:serine/threonine protein kinase/tetratricopeptide (TPR) repeat protein
MKSSNEDARSGRAESAQAAAHPLSPGPASPALHRDEAGIEMDDRALAGSLGRTLARKMRRRWRRGERPLAEEFLGSELLRRPEIALDVIYEEYCLRLAAGERAVDREIVHRFPQWREPLRVMLDCHLVLQANATPSDFPCVGDQLGGFRLVDELGRGARGRVFLATQTDLAARPVVLKITPLDGAEHLCLARLQHTNIVPVYSVEDDAERNIRILCMPHFGRATLASLIKSLADVPVAARTGQHVVTAIDQAHDEPLEPALAAAPARQMLSHVSYVQATCWITACLADALACAHEHGLVHLDVKPSNVLLASDGQPMLLDFHLAREPIRCDGLLPDRFGGTPAYMAPEQRAVMEGLKRGVSAEHTVDARADVYALGAILYELLGGRLACIGTAPPLSQLNSQVSVGLADIVSNCLSQRAGERYPSARALADDLRRHLTDQPLIGAPNRSLRERWDKWRRRRPNTVRTAVMLGAVAAAGTLACAGAWSWVLDRCRAAEQALREGQSQLESGRQSAEAVVTLERGLKLIDNIPFRRDVRGQLREQLATARRLRAASQLHQLADQIRELYGTGSLSPVRSRPLLERAHDFWEKRRMIAESLDSHGHSDVAMDLLDLAIFWAELQVQLAPADKLAATRLEAIATLDEAEAMFGQSRVLDYQRQMYRTVAGQAYTLASAPLPLLRAENAAENGHAATLRMAWEHYALGRSLLNSNNLAQAAEELEAALAIDPSGQWPNFYYGLCAHRMGRHDDAVAAFSVCIGAAPNLAGCYYNRALVSANQGRTDRALHDYERAIELDPTLAAAWLNRGMLYYKLQQYAEAATDLRQAIKHGADPAAAHYDLALVHLADHNAVAALNEVDNALANEPDHVQARELRQTLLQTNAASPGGR